MTGTSASLSEAPDAGTSSDSPFAVGDKVLIAESRITSMPNGSIWEVEQVDSDGDVWINNYCHSPHRLHPADPEAKYEPVVGDVVEFEYEGKEGILKGIVFRHRNGRDALATGELESNCFYVGGVRGSKKIGFTTRLGTIGTFTQAHPIAKAYFSDTKDKPSAPPAPYSVKQAEWVKEHDIKVGSKVKVVRKFELNEDGYSSAGWNSNPVKARMQGKVEEVVAIREGYIQLSCSYLPYFALEPVT